MELVPQPIMDRRGELHSGAALADHKVEAAWIPLKDAVPARLVSADRAFHAAGKGGAGPQAHGGLRGILPFGSATCRRRTSGRCRRSWWPISLPTALPASPSRTSTGSHGRPDRQDLFLRRIAIPHELLQPEAIGRRDSNGNTGSHEPDSHAIKHRSNGQRRRVTG